MRLARVALAFVAGCMLGDYRVEDAGQNDVQSADVFVSDAASDAAADAIVDVAVDTGPESYRQTVLDDQPLLYLRLGESSASGGAHDEVTSGPAGTYQSAISYGQTGAITNDPNTAISLSGGYVTVGNYFPFPGTSPFTLEAWVRPTGGGGQFQQIVMKRDYQTPSEWGYSLFLGSGAGCVQRFKDQNTYDTACTSAALPTNGYTYLVATYDGSMLRLYAQGTLAASQPSALAIATTTSTLCIGCDPFFSSALMGSVDEVAVYGQALSGARVAAHYAAAK